MDMHACPHALMLLLVGPMTECDFSHAPLAGGACRQVLLGPMLCPSAYKAHVHKAQVQRRPHPHANECLQNHGGLACRRW